MTPEQLEMLVLEAIGKELRDGIYHCDWHATHKEIKELPADDLPDLMALFEGALHFRGWLSNDCEISVIGGRFISWEPDPEWTWEAAIFCHDELIDLMRTGSTNELSRIIQELVEQIHNG